jgi:hypothetical protein
LGPRGTYPPRGFIQPRRISVAIEAIVWTLNASESAGHTRLVAICIANHLGHHKNNGWICWPSVKTLACGARCSIRQAQYAIQELVDFGEMQIMQRAGGRGQTAIYRMPKFEAWYASQNGKGAQYAPFEKGAQPVQKGAQIDEKGAQRAENAPPYHNKEFNRNRTVRNPADNSSAAAQPLSGAQKAKANRIEREQVARSMARVGRGPEMPHGTRVNPKILEKVSMRMLRPRQQKSA